MSSFRVYTDGSSQLKSVVRGTSHRVWEGGWIESVIGKMLRFLECISKICHRSLKQLDSAPTNVIFASTGDLLLWCKSLLEEAYLWLAYCVYLDRFLSHSLNVHVARAARYAQNISSWICAHQIGNSGRRDHFLGVCLLQVV